jgi:hypothetical protein
MHTVDGKGISTQEEMDDKFHQYMYQVGGTGDDKTLRSQSRRINDAITTLKTYVNTAPREPHEWGPFSTAALEYMSPTTLNRYLELPICHD